MTETEHEGVVALGVEDGIDAIARVRRSTWTFTPELRYYRPGPNWPWQLQQKCRNDFGETEWRDVPMVTE